MKAIEVVRDRLKIILEEYEKAVSDGDFYTSAKLLAKILEETKKLSGVK